MMRRLNVNYGRTNSAILLLTPTPAALGTLLLPAGCSGSGSDLRRLRRPYYDRRFHRLPHPSLLDPPWAWSTEASRRTWATRTRLAAAAAHCLPRMCFLLACARGARQATASSDGTAAGRRGVPLALAPWHPPLAGWCKVSGTEDRGPLEPDGPAIDDRIDRERDS